MFVRADSVLTTLTLDGLTRGLAIIPGTDNALVTNFGGMNVYKVDLNSMTKLGEIGGVGIQPRDVVVSSDGTFALVSNSQISFPDKLVRINLGTGAIEATISFPGAPWMINRVLIDRLDRYAYVTSTFTYRIDLLNNTVQEFDTSFQADGIALSSDGRYLYLAKPSRITKTDLTTGQVVSSFPLVNASKIALSPNDDFLLASTSDSSIISRIDTASGSVTGSLDLGGSEIPSWIAIAPSASFAYATGLASSRLTKFNLSTMTASSLSLSTDAQRVTISRDGKFAYTSGGTKIAKVALDSLDPQTISFDEPPAALLGSKTVTLTPTATSTLPVTLAAETSDVCVVEGMIVSLKAIGNCTIAASQAGGRGWLPASEVKRTFKVLPDPPAGEPGVSINEGSSATNSKSVQLSLVWPALASEARISNDGGFALAKTKTVAVGAKISWDLDDSVKGLYTKVVYVRFSGVGIDTTKTYSDDIILDTTAPTVTTSSAVAANGELNVVINASDDITGVDRVEVRNNEKVISRNFSASISIPLENLGLVSGSVSKASASGIDFRIVDGAKNWTDWKPLKVSGADTKTSSSSSGKLKGASVALARGASASFARLLAASQVNSAPRAVITSARIVAGTKICRLTKTRLTMIGSGRCSVRIAYRQRTSAVQTRTIIVTAS